MARMRLKHFPVHRSFHYIVVILFLLTLIGLLVEYKHNGIKHNFGQDVVDNFAKNLVVTYRLIANGVKGSNINQYEAEISITNNADRVLPGHDWEIFFSQLVTIEPDHYPYPSGYEKKEYGVRFFHWNGQLNSFRPTKDFGYLIPGATKTIRVLTESWNIAVTDTYPNWYILFTGYEPRVIASTETDPFKFVQRCNTSICWSKNHDKIVKLTSPADRYKEKVKDLQHAPLPVLPTPLIIDSFNPLDTVKAMRKPTAVLYEAMFEKEATLLAERWKLELHKLPTNRSTFNCVLFEMGRLNLQGKDVVKSEAYSISTISAKGSIQVKAIAPAGAFYAVQTLLTLPTADGRIPEINITDGPRNRYRGLMIDIARNFHGKDTIKRYLDLMAMYKLNKLHLHLSDDEGWRLQIPGLSELTEIGGRRCHDPNETICILPFLGAPLEQKPPGSGYLTVLEYKELLQYAVDRHIEIIPEIDLPGHSHAAIKAMEARFLKTYKTDLKAAQKYLLSDLKDLSDYSSVQRFKDNVVNPCISSTYDFIEKVVNAIYNMHKDISPLKMMHMGGDEIPSKAWSESPMCRSLLEYDKFVPKEIFLTKVSEILAAHNLDLALWEDGFSRGHGVLTNRAAFQGGVYGYIWNDVVNSFQAEALLRHGYKVILTGASHLYFDHPYEVDPLEPGLTWANRELTTKRVYLYVPDRAFANTENSPGEMCAEGEGCTGKKLNNFEGIQGTLFGELVRSQDIMDYMMLPRVIALAERAWRQAPWFNVKDSVGVVKAMDSGWTDFANTIGYRELARLDKLGFKYRVPPPGAIISDGVLHTATEFPGLLVEMSRNGTGVWIIVDSGQTKVEPGELVLLRTRSANRKRYSKIVTVVNR